MLTAMKAARQRALRGGAGGGSETSGGEGKEREGGRERGGGREREKRETEAPIPGVSESETLIRRV